MVGVDGQFLFKFRIQDREDFINTEDLLYFKLCEAAGNVLPTFEIAFVTLDEKLLGLFHESNDIQVSFGQDRDSLTDIKLVPMRMTPTRAGVNKHMIVANGFYSALGYINNDNVFISNKLSGVEAIKQIAAKHFNVSGTFNLAKGFDSQNWIQSAMPDRLFVNQMWMHSNLPNSFPAIGISSDGKFILKDIKLALKQDFKWRFTPNVQTARDIHYDGDYATDYNTGFINNWVGYTREKTIYNLEAGSESILSNTTKPIMSLTKEIAKRAEIEKRYAQAGIISDNVHAEYWSSYLRNLSSLAVLASVKNTLSFTGVYKPVRVLDLVMLKEDSVASNTGESSEYNSGLHFITKVARSVQNSKLTTVVECSRESVNALKGDFLPADPVPVVVPTPLTDQQKLIADLKARFPGKF